MPKIYFYKLTVDNGGAPCVHNDLLSLAICKPILRKTAMKHDLVFGFAADSLERHSENRLIYVASVAERLPNGTYYTSGEYAHRGDCIYRLNGKRFEWRHGSLHHGPDHLEHDLGKSPVYERANVLLSRDFRYFGKSGTAEYKTEFTLVRDAVEGLGRGHRVHHSRELYDEFVRMKEWLWKKYRHTVNGGPTTQPSHSVCHRSRSCGVVESLIERKVARNV